MGWVVKDVEAGFVVAGEHQEAAADAARREVICRSRLTEYDWCYPHCWCAVQAFLEDRGWVGYDSKGGDLEPRWFGTWDPYDPDAEIRGVLNVLAPFVVANGWCQWRDEKGNVTLATFDGTGVTYAENHHEALTNLDVPRFARIIRWEGSLDFAVDVGIKPEDIADPELSALWSRFCAEGPDADVAESELLELLGLDD